MNADKFYKETDQISSLPRWGKVAHRKKNVNVLWCMGGVTDEVVLKTKNSGQNRPLFSEKSVYLKSFSVLDNVCRYKYGKSKI